MLLKYVKNLETYCIPVSFLGEILDSVKFRLHKYVIEGKINKSEEEVEDISKDYDRMYDYALKSGKADEIIDILSISVGSSKCRNLISKYKQDPYEIYDEEDFRDEEDMKNPYDIYAEEELKDPYDIYDEEEINKNK